MKQARQTPRISADRVKVSEACHTLAAQFNAVMPLQVWSLEWLFDYYDIQQRTDT